MCYKFTTNSYKTVTNSGVRLLVRYGHRRDSVIYLLVYRVHSNTYIIITSSSPFQIFCVRNYRNLILYRTNFNFINENICTCTRLLKFYLISFRPYKIKYFIYRRIRYTPRG